MDSTIKSCRIIQYADDTCLFVCGKNTTDIINTLAKDVENIIDYFSSHKLRINIAKTNFMIIRKKSQNNNVENETLRVCNETIKQVIVLNISVS